MKRKILAIALVVCMLIVAIAGASLAYFTDKDEKVNVFTSGKVDITLNEVFDATEAQLIPGVDIQKDVTVSLSSDSIATYVWYTYAIPTALDDAGVIHVNHAGRNLVDYREDSAYWAAGQTSATPIEDCWKISSTVEKGVVIDGESYNVYTVLYNGTLTAGETTTVGMTKVYCDTKVDFDNATGKYVMNGTAIGGDLNNVKIIVTAYGIQAATFANVEAAYAAYSAQNIAGAAIDID
ncbi:MAG: hypothetical protein J6S71_10135 [Clostridia bacterium]|nr:hypothetical protein [Clostridia bacterium]